MSVQCIIQVAFRNTAPNSFYYRVSYLYCYNYEVQVPIHEEPVYNATIKKLRKVFKHVKANPTITKIRVHKNLGRYEDTQCVSYYCNW